MWGWNVFTFVASFINDLRMILLRQLSLEGVTIVILAINTLIATNFTTRAVFNNFLRKFDNGISRNIMSNELPENVTD